MHPPFGDKIKPPRGPIWKDLSRKWCSVSGTGGFWNWSDPIDGGRWPKVLSAFHCPRCQSLFPRFRTGFLVFHWTLARLLQLSKRSLVEIWVGTGRFPKKLNIERVAADLYLYGTAAHAPLLHGWLINLTICPNRFEYSEGSLTILGIILDLWTVSGNVASFECGTQWKKFKFWTVLKQNIIPFRNNS